MTRVRARSARPRRWFVTTLALVLAAPLLAAIAVVVDTSAPAVADATDPTAPTCLDAEGQATGCQFDVEQIPLPGGKTIGEYELAAITRTGDHAGVSMREFVSGTDVGSCDPSQYLCNRLTDTFPIGPDADAPVKVPSATTADDPVPTSRMDSAVAEYDLNGDGASDVVTAGRCSSRDREICLTLFNPARADSPSGGYSAPQRTGLYADGVGFGRIRLAAGLINERASNVVGATYKLVDGGMLATFTTQAPNDYEVGQLVRFKFPGASDLQDQLCVTPDDGVEQCIGDLGSQYLPIEAVDGDTFSVRLGQLVDASEAEGALVPPDWTCDDPAECAAVAVAVRPGLAMAWAAPTQSAQLAAFGVRAGADKPFGLIDSTTLGRLLGSTDMGRAPLDVVVGDFDGAGVDDIAVGWGAVGSDRACTVGDTPSPCGIVSIFGTNNGQQLVQATRSRFVSGYIDYISMASGMLVDDVGTNINGEDLGIGYAMSGDHRVGIFDVRADKSLAQRFSQRFWIGSSSIAVSASYIKVATGDLDVDGTDELIVAETRQTSTPQRFGNFTPITVSVIRRDGDTFTTDPGVWSPPGGTFASGPWGRGQIDLKVGQLGRREGTVQNPFPDTVNPDIVVSWTCDNQTWACPGEYAVATMPLSVTVNGPGSPVGSYFTLGAAGQKPLLLPSSPAPVDATAPDSGVRYEYSQAAVALPDLNVDSETLGFPVTYVKVNEVRPLLILRAPPVHIDAFDTDGTPGVNYFEVKDINGCFDGYNDCSDSSFLEYAASTSVDSNVSATITNDWGVSASAKAGVGNSDTEVEVYLKGSFDYAGQSEQAKDFSKSFSLTSTQTLNSGFGDRGYLAVQSSRVTEFPVYAGVSAGLSRDDASRFVVSINPAETEFRWENLTNPNFWYDPSAPVSGNILSYPRSVASASAGVRNIESVKRTSANTVEVKVETGHGYTCDVDNWSNLSTKYLASYPCGAGGVPVSISGAGVFSGNYTATQIIDSQTIRLTSTKDFDANASYKCFPGHCLLRRSPGYLSNDFVSVGKNGTSSQQLEMSSQSNFSGSASWVAGGGLEYYGRVGGSIDIPVPTVGFEAAPAPLFELNVQGTYSRTESSTLGVAATVGTSYTWKVGKGTDGAPYAVRPMLSEDPATSAMTLDWAVDVESYKEEQFWRRYYSSRPDPALSLPRLMTPYKSPGGIPDVQGDVLPTSSVVAWTCDKDGRCYAPGAFTPGQRVNLGVVIRNFSLQAFTSDRPMKLRFFMGDPSLGGYQIAETDIPDVVPLATTQKAYDLECGGARFCIPSQASVVASAPWVPPKGLSGSGSFTNRMPIYVVIDPLNKVKEVQDWNKPINMRDCAATYPYLPPRPADQYDPSESDCPTSNNEGWFTPEFAGERQPRTDLSIRSSDIDVSRRGEVSVKVRSTGQAPSGNAVRLWFCRPNAKCVPQTSPQWAEQQRLGAISAGGQQTVKFATNLKSGNWVVWAQVVPLSSYETPGGGPDYLRLGDLRNNQASIDAKVA